MNFLLDTHVFIWWDQQNPLLNAGARMAIEDGGNNVFVSAASVWEIAIKRRRGKLKFRGSAAGAIAANGFLELPILPRDAEAAGDLVWEHGDPFDRMLVVQAIGQDLVFITADETIRDLDGVAKLWAGVRRDPLGARSVTDEGKRRYEAIPRRNVTRPIVHAEKFATACSAV